MLQTNKTLRDVMGQEKIDTHFDILTAENKIHFSHFKNVSSLTAISRAFSLSLEALKNEVEIKVYDIKVVFDWRKGDNEPTWACE